MEPERGSWAGPGGPSGLHKRRSRSAQHVLREAQDFVWHVVSSDSAKRWREQMKSKTTEVRGRVRQRTAKVGQRVREQLSHQQVVKFFDKTGFMLGVLGLISTEFVLLRFPQFFGLWFAATIPPLVAIRWCLYSLAKHQFFLFDFCYFVQVGTLVNLFFFPDSRHLWRLHFVLAQGPLLWAIPTWRNSFVFHSLDKVTSVFIHLFPALLTYVKRWEADLMCDASTPCHMDWASATLFPLAYYSVWQVLYILKTEVSCRALLRQDRSIATSVRWLAADRSHPLNVLTTRVCRRCGVLRPEEELDAETWKTKVIFWAVQLLYTLLTFLPAKLAFDHRGVCVLLIGVCVCVSVWNGANYYIEVFSTRYTLKFKEPPPGPGDQVSPAPSDEPAPGSPAAPRTVSPGLTSDAGTEKSGADWKSDPGAPPSEEGPPEAEAATPEPAMSHEDPWWEW
eukprot:EG_transcript_9728